MAESGQLIAEVTSGDPERTRRLGAALASVLEAGDVVVLAGDLGAGKTTFAQGVARGLGVDESVTSPTFTLVRPYRCAAGRPEAPRTLLHADLYRLDALAEVVDLGLGELVEDGAAALIEWGDVATDVLGPDILEVGLELAGEARPDERVIVVTATGSQRWSRRARLLSEALSATGHVSAEGSAAPAGDR